MQMTVVLVQGILGLALGIVIGYLVSKAIVNPLKVFLKEFDCLSKGDLTLEGVSEKERRRTKAGKPVQHRGDR